jgi:spermidine/putrescine-binding protein
MSRSRIAAGWIALAAASASGPVPAAQPDTRPVLRILNWSDYIDLDEAVPAPAPIPDRSPSLRRFQREAGCRIEYFEFDEAVEMNARVMNMPGFFDVVMVSQDDAGQMIRAGLTRAFPAGRFEGPDGLISGCVPFGTAGGKRHFLPYLVGVLGLAVRADAGHPPVDRWTDVFDPRAGTAPRIGLTACPFEQTYAALKWQGRSLSTTNREELAAAVRALGTLRKSGRLAVMTSDMDTLGRALVGNRADAVMMYSTDARALIDENPGVPIRFVVPAEGAELYIDGWVVLAASRQPDLAVRFVEFMASPGIHADVAGWLGARPATTAAMAELRKREPDFEKSPTLAPPPDASGNCEAPSVVAQDIVPLWTGVMATPSPAGPKP